MAPGGPQARVTAHRFFVRPESIAGDSVTLTAEQRRQISTVLRLRPGDSIIVLDNTGMEYDVRLTDEDGVIERRRPNRAEPPVALSLYQGLLKGAKLELVLQKGTELGVRRFVPVLTARSVAGEPGKEKARRYEAIVREAAEQSGRGCLPVIDRPLAFPDALHDALERGPALLPWEGEQSTRLEPGDLPAHGELSLIVGPEGGFTAAEVDQARGAGARIVTLGPRILRAETAAIVASALVLYLADIDGSSSRSL